MKQRYIVLIPDILERWRPGEIGELEENDFPEEYEFKLRLPGSIRTTLFGSCIAAARVFYFHATELKEKHA